MTRLVGVLGGMGPLATIHFMKAVMENTSAVKDQDHLDMLVSQHCSIPDRTAAILGKGPDPCGAMVTQALVLQNAGAQFIAVPCNTANRFMNQVRNAVRIPVLDIVQETVSRLRELGSWKNIGLLATQGTVNARVYQDILEEQDLKVILPNDALQERINALIYDYVKAGKQVPVTKFEQIIAQLRSSGAQAIICGCTEISVIYRDLHITDSSIVDSLTALARATVVFADGKLRV